MRNETASVVVAHVALNKANRARMYLQRDPEKGMTGQVDLVPCPPDTDDQGRSLVAMHIHVIGDEKAIRKVQNLLTVRCAAWSPYGWSGTTLLAQKEASERA